MPIGLPRETNAIGIGLPGETNAILLFPLLHHASNPLLMIYNEDQTDLVGFRAGVLYSEA